MAGNGAMAGSGGSAAGGDPACADSLPAPRAVLLTPRQYVNALRDLLGPDAVSEQDAAAVDEVEMDLVDRPWVNTASIDRVVRLAETATETLRGRTAQVLGCSALTDRACVRTAIGELAERAYKRPLDAAELDDVMTVYDEGLAAVTDDAGESGALLALQAVLAAPSTLYRTEFREPAGAQGPALSAHERAAALAAWLLDSVPDAPLLAAASDGSLLTAQGLQAQIDRLLGLPRVQEHLTEIVLSAYKASRVFETPKDSELFPDYTPALQVSMYEESRRFVGDVLFERAAPLSELITSRRTFVDGALAELYGVAHSGANDAFAEVQLPEQRAGLLTQASVMSVLSRTDKTSVVARGLFVRGALLCLPKIPSPPDSVQAEVAMQLDATATQQELADYRAATQPCNGCHAQFDRFGLLLEAFDPIGALRMQTPTPIDFEGLLPQGGVIASPSALAQQMADDGSFVRCLAERTLAFAVTEPHRAGATCTTDPLAAALQQGGGTLHALVSAIAAQPSFAQRTN